MDKKTFFIQTFGCQMNENDSDLIRSKFIEKGWEEADSLENADFVIVNTCAVREKAELKALWNIRSLQFKFKDNTKIAIIGCSAKHLQEKIFEYVPFANYVIGPDNYRFFDEILNKENFMNKKVVKVGENNEELYEDFVSDYKIDGFKAYVTIIRGCNNFCSYCIVPYTRGRERSRDYKKIIDDIKQLLDKGIKEIMLLGQNVNSYNYNNVGFPDLLDKIANIKGLERIRFLTSHPKDFNKELVNVIKSYDNITNWLHLPFQAGSNRILKLMNRKYTKEEYLEKIQMVKEEIPDITLSTDIIVAFPTETEEDFLETLDVVKKVEFDSAFMFIYSPRSGTLAAKKYKDTIEEEIKKERMDRLVKLQMDITKKKSLEQVGKIKKVLVEEFKEDKKSFIGRGEDNRVVFFEKKDNLDALVGTFVDVLIKDATAWSLKGELLS